VKDEVGEDFSVMIKLNCHDFVAEQAVSLEDSLYLSMQLAKYGIDAIEVSGGIPASGEFGPSRQEINKRDDEAYFLEMAEEIKKISGVPLILVGGIRSIDCIAEILEGGLIDYISMSRPFIYEPDLPNRWKSGDLEKAKCISCNDCFEPAKDGKGIYCVTRSKLENRTS